MGSGVRSSQVACLDADGNREPFCLDEECNVRKCTVRFRTKLIDGIQYVVDIPPANMQ